MLMDGGVTCGVGAGPIGGVAGLIVVPLLLLLALPLAGAGAVAGLIIGVEWAWAWPGAAVVVAACWAGGVTGTIENVISGLAGTG